MISILIEADEPHLHFYKEIRIGNTNEPVALSTPLGRAHGRKVQQ